MQESLKENPFNFIEKNGEMLLNLRFEYTSIMASWFIYNQFRSAVLFMSRFEQSFNGIVIVIVSVADDQDC